MKKIFAILSIIAMFAISGCTCGRQADTEAVVDDVVVETVDTTEVAVDTLVVAEAE